MAARGRGLISLYIYIENFKNLLVRNHWTDFIITWQKCFLVDPLTRLFKLSWFVKKPGRQGGGAYFPYIIYIEKLKNLLVRNQWTNFNITWQECYFGDPLPRLFKPSWFVKNMAARGWRIFSLYIYIENFKNLLLRNLWIEFNVTWQECCFGDLLPKIVHALVIRQNIWPPGGWGLFFVYICMENFKILLVRNHLTDFNITWQECCFGDPLPRLFKQSWFVKKTCLLGVGLIFPIYLYRKL